MFEWLFLLIIMVLLTLMVYLGWDRKILNKIRRSKQQPYNYCVLFSILLIGFFFGWEYTERWGCFGGYTPVFGLKNILLSFISIGLISASYFTKQQKYKLVWVLVELGFWVFKLFYFKNNTTSVFLYDSIALIFRLFIISSLLTHQLKFRTIVLMVMAIIGVKLFVFSESIASILEIEEGIKRSKLTHAHLIGNWVGVCRYDSISVQEIIHLPDTGLLHLDWIIEADTEYIEKRIPIIDSIEIHIDSTWIILSGIKNIDSLQLRYTFDYEFGGYLKEIEDTISSDYEHRFRLGTPLNDTLRLNLRLRSNAYKLYMTK